jgi:hypothetical protein
MDDAKRGVQFLCSPLWHVVSALWRATTHNLFPPVKEKDGVMGAIMWYVHAPTGRHKRTHISDPLPSLAIVNVSFAILCT